MAVVVRGTARSHHIAHLIAGFGCRLVAPVDPAKS
jgi:hypothetical protein